MHSQRWIESFVGIFLLAAIIALVVLAFKVSGLTTLFPTAGYTVSARFEDIGQLKIRAPIKMSGVMVGEVVGIMLDPVTFKAVVKMHIDAKYNDIPDDSSISILTAGLLGDNYISITPMYSTHYLREGSELQYTHSAMVLEKLIGQFLFKLGKSDDTTKGADNAKKSQ